MNQDPSREYDGILLTEITSVCRSEIERIARSSGLLENFDITDSYLEFRFAGRDCNRFVVQMLSAMAAVIKDANGEIRCTTTIDNSRDSTFEFFTVEGGQLMKQSGRIVRGERQPLETS